MNLKTLIGLCLILSTQMNSAFGPMFECTGKFIGPAYSTNGLDTDAEGDFKFQKVATSYDKSNWRIDFYTHYQGQWNLAGSVPDDYVWNAANGIGDNYFFSITRVGAFKFSLSQDYGNRGSVDISGKTGTGTGYSVKEGSIQCGLFSDHIRH